MGGMRGVGFSALLGLSDFRKERLPRHCTYIISNANIRMRKCLCRVRGFTDRLFNK